MSRPYISFKIQELEKLFADNQHNVGVLKQLCTELLCRTANRAHQLRRRVEERLCSITGTASPSDFLNGRAAGLKPEISTDRRSTDQTHSTRTVTPPSVEQGKATEADDPKGMSAGAVAPDDRRRPSSFSRISAPGVRGRPDPFQPALDTDVVLKIPAGATRAVRYAVALDALVAEMRKKGSGQKRYELENGRVVDHQAGQHVYAFAFNEDATIFEDAEVEIECGGSGFLDSGIS